MHPHMSFMFLSNARYMFVLTEQKLISYFHSVGKQPIAYCLGANADEDIEQAKVVYHYANYFAKIILKIIIIVLNYQIILYNNVYDM